MKELVIISGKGGTGKTSIMGAFATLAKNKILCDADVEKGFRFCCHPIVTGWYHH
jgi:MinD superfamily P-loop ATPase